MSLIPRLNSIPGTQMIHAEDIANMTDSHDELANYSLQLDYIQRQIFTLQNQVNHSDVYMKTHFKQVEGSIEHLTTSMSLLYSMIKKINTTTVAERTFFEGGSGGGGEGDLGSGDGSGNADKGKGKEDPHASRSKSVEDSSTKGEKSQPPQGSQPHQQEELGGSGSKDKAAEEESRRDKGKGKHVLHSFDEDYYYQGEHDEFDAFNILEEEQEEIEELPMINEHEEEASFDDYEEEGEVPSDPAFTKEFKKQQQDLKRKEGELEKISQVISKKAQLFKAENEEKQRLHNLKVQRRKLHVRLKLGDN